VAQLVRENLDQLRQAGLKPGAGDVRCITYGHLTRLAVWRLRRQWDKDLPVARKLLQVAEELSASFTFQEVDAALSGTAPVSGLPLPVGLVLEEAERYGESTDEISF